MANQLQAGQSLLPGQSLTSTNGLYTLFFQTDSNLVLYRNNLQQEPLWASGTQNKNAVICTMQKDDGNLVLCTQDNQPVWASGQYGPNDKDSFLLIEDDGNAVIYRPSGEPIWSTNTKQTVYNPKLKNIEEAYKAVSNDGHKVEYKGEPWIPNMVESHIQGVAYYGNYAIFSHNNKGYSEGRLIIVNREENKLVHNLVLPVENFNHPGGIQTIGNFLVVPVEHATENKSYILFYDLTVLTDSTEPFLLSTPRIDRSSGAQQGKAGAAGITNYTDTDQTERYKLAIYDNGEVDMYTSNEFALGDDRCQFSFSTHLTLDDKGLSELCLLTSEDQNINMIGFNSTSSGLTYKDELVLYDRDENQLESRHFTTHHGSIVGIAGVHFRWGAGLQILPFSDKSPTLSVYCTQRNFVGDHVVLNNFPPTD